MSIQITRENRHLYGGDYALTRTVPKTHPMTGAPLLGTRASIRGASRYHRSFFRGDIINIADPESDWNFTLCPLANDARSRDYFLLLKLEKGFEPCVAKEWDLLPELQQIYEVENGQLILRGAPDPTGRTANYEIVMCRPAARMLQEEAAMRQIDQIAPHAQQGIASAIEGSGVSVMETRIETIAHRYNPDAMEAQLSGAASPQGS